MKKPRLLPIGHHLHILNPRFHQALENRDQDLLLELAGRQVTAGARALAINPGPAARFKAQLSWLVTVIQEKYPVPLLLPMAGPALTGALESHRGRGFINAVTGDPAQLTAGLDLAREFDANLVVLLTRPGSRLATSEDRLRVALDVLERADRQGLAPERLYLDPVLTIRPDPRARYLGHGLPDLEPVLETISLIRELSGGRCRTILALDNAMPGQDKKERSLLRQRMLMLLDQAGLNAVMLDPLDHELMRVAADPEQMLFGERKAA